MQHHTSTPFPVLTTQRLTLRQLLLIDEQAIFTLRSNTEVNKYLDRAPCTSLAHAVQFIQMIQKLMANKEAVYWVITLANTQTIVGTIGLFNFNTSAVEIGFELLPSFEKQGIMYEACVQVIQYVFEKMNCISIYASTHVHNQKSITLLGKLNFIQIAKADSATENENVSKYILVK